MAFPSTLNLASRGAAAAERRHISSEFLACASACSHPVTLKHAATRRLTLTHAGRRRYVVRKSQEFSNHHKLQDSQPAWVADAHGCPSPQARKHQCLSTRFRQPSLVVAGRLVTAPYQLPHACLVAARRFDQLTDSRLLMLLLLNYVRSEIVTLRAERDKAALHANFSQERLERFVEELDHQRGEAKGILARNVELSRLIIDYEMKLQERSESLIVAEEHSRRLITEASLKAIRSTEEVCEVTLVLDPFLETGCITLLAGVKEKQLLEALSPRHCALSLIGFMLHV
ncbi:hypothetical protein Dimus_010960 [Dionaea muscipula]